MQSISFIEVLMISLGLGADAFSVALASGAQGFTARRLFRLSWHFGLFQFLMPIIGWLAGEAVAGQVGVAGKWIALLLLAGIGGKMVYEGIRGDGRELPDLSKGWKLVTLSIGTSLDALAVGFGLGMLGTAIVVPAAIIGVVCAAMTSVGLYLGVWLYRGLGCRALVLGGVILMGIGIKLVI